MSTHEDQLRHGTYREQLTSLQSALDDAIQSGATNVEDFTATLTQILKAIEGLRVKNENQISNLREQIAFHEATARACSLLGSVVVGVVRSRTQEHRRGQANLDVALKKELRDDIYAEHELALREGKDVPELTEDQIETEVEKRFKDRKLKNRKLPFQPVKTESDVAGNDATVPVGSVEEAKMLGNVISDAVRKDENKRRRRNPRRATKKSEGK